MTTVHVDPDTQAAQRARFIADLRAMADWLEANPVFPIGFKSEGARLQHSASRFIALESRRGYVDHLASLMGVKVRDMGQGCYMATKTIGAVEYVVYADSEPHGQDAER